LAHSSSENKLFSSKEPILHRMDFVEKVTLDKVTYRYPNIKEPALTDISLTIKKGQSIALIGKSGQVKQHWLM